MMLNYELEDFHVSYSKYYGSMTPGEKLHQTWQSRSVLKKTDPCLNGENQIFFFFDCFPFW